VKLAIIGTRGVPANYGGFETFAEELGARLAERGHRVTVYGRRGFIDPKLGEYRGMRLVVLPSVRRKHLETVSNTLLASLHAVDGLERKRRKWGIAGRAYYRLGEYLAARLPNALVTDAEVIRRYYHRAYKASSEMIVYGGDLEPPTGTDKLAALGLSPGEYLFYVSRFEPENNPDRVVEAYREVDGSRPLVMVGGAPYAPNLTRRVAELADDRVLLPGPVYGEGYRQLLFNCRAYIHATEVGGTHPALVEAMGAGRPVLYYDTPENREVAGDVGMRFRFSGANNLDTMIADVIDDDGRLEEMGRRSRQRVDERYRWSDVADRYEKVLEGLC
jgi:glycosyltransferase involved in cell wall biosynthesis